MPTKKNLSEKADKRRRAKVIVGHDASGDPITKYASGRTKKELTANVEELRKTYINGALEVRRSIMTEQFIQEWYEVYKEPKLSDSSRRNYTLALNKFIMPAIGQKQMRAVRPEDLQRIMNGMEGKGRSTIGDVYGILVRSFRKAVADGIIDRDPSLSLTKPTAKATPRRELTEAETNTVLAVADTHPDGLLLKLLYYTGARRGEALGLQWADVDFKGRRMHIKRDIDAHTGEIDTLKTKHSLRWIPIPAQLYAALEQCRGVGATFVLQPDDGTPYWRPDYYQRHWNALMEAVYDHDKTVEHRNSTPSDPDSPMRSILTAHYFRHNYATLLYDAGVDVLVAQSCLGHADPATTLRIYTHLKEARKDNDASLIDMVFSKKVAKRLPEPKN